MYFLPCGCLSFLNLNTWCISCLLIIKINAAKGFVLIEDLILKQVSGPNLFRSCIFNVIYVRRSEKAWVVSPAKMFRHHFAALKF